MRQLVRLRRLTQRGDTIVEVMVVLAVLGLAIGVAYATVNSSSRANQAAQDNSQAVATLKGQVELLRAYANDPAYAHMFDYNSNPTVTSFCLDPATAGPILVSVGTCKSGIFAYSIYYSGNSAINLTNPDLFTLKVTWPDIDGGQASSTIVYRIHKQS